MSEADRFPWRRNFPDYARWDAPIEVGLLPDLLTRAATRFGDRPLIEFRDRHISFRGLAEMADRLAAGLLAAGIGRGDSVALYLPNTPWHPVAFFAVVRIGARVVHLSALDAPRELAHKLHDSGAKLLLTTNLPGLLPNALRLLAEGSVARVFVGEDADWGPSPAGLPVPWSEQVAPMPSAVAPACWPELHLEDVAVLQYTGGTTGLPKGAMLSHRNLTAAVSMYGLTSETAEQAGDKMIAVLPLFHIYALTCVLLRGIVSGWELLLRLRFDPDALLADIQVKRAGMFPGVPTMWIALAKHPAAVGADFSSLRACSSGGAPMPFEVSQRIERLVGTKLGGGWGMTETSPAGTRIPPDVPMTPGLIGVPLPGIELRVVDLLDPSRPLPPDEIGELAVRGLNVFQGYWNQPEATRAAFRDGFFLTGDIGAMDARGLFRILDRKKHMIISAGFNVYPAAIESAIYEHPSIAEVVVVGIPDDYRGQAAKAFVTLRPDAETLTLAALTAFLADRLGRHEMPAALEIRDTLPRSPAGKLLAKPLLDEELAKARAG